VSVQGENCIPVPLNLLLRSVLLSCVLSWSSLISQSSEEPRQRIPFCTLLRDPDRYRDSLITLRVRVKSFRHGTLISDPSCSKQGIGLIPNQSAVQTASVSRFYQFLQEHRLSKTPILATITGRLVKPSDSGFVRRDVVFKLESVSEVSEGGKTGNR
jgi:hypothetical protein